MPKLNLRHNLPLFIALLVVTASIPLTAYVALTQKADTRSKAGGGFPEQPPLTYAVTEIGTIIPWGGNVLGVQQIAAIPQGEIPEATPTIRPRPPTPTPTSTPSPTPSTPCLYNQNGTPVCPDYQQRIDCPAGRIVSSGKDKCGCNLYPICVPDPERPYPNRCQPRPGCLDSQPACRLPEPTGGWCPPTSITQTPQQCTNMWWFDSDSRECTQKQFCDMYSYGGLRTFADQDDCNEALYQSFPSNLPPYALRTEDGRIYPLTKAKYLNSIDFSAYVNKQVLIEGYMGQNSKVSCNVNGVCTLLYNPKNLLRLPWWPLPNNLPMAVFKVHPVELINPNTSINSINPLQLSPDMMFKTPYEEKNREENVYYNGDYIRSSYRDLNYLVGQPFSMKGSLYSVDGKIAMFNEAKPSYPSPYPTTTPTPTYSYYPTITPTHTPTPTPTVSPIPAIKETDLFFSPTDQTVYANRNFTTQIKMNTGSNKAGGMELVLTFNPKVLEITSLQPDPNNFRQILEQPVIENNIGKARITIGVGIKNIVQGQNLPVLKVIGKTKTIAPENEGQYSIAISNQSHAYALNAENYDVLRNASPYFLFVKNYFPGDIDGDDYVYLFDYSKTAGNYGTDFGIDCDFSLTRIKGDVIEDCSIDIFDYAMVVGNFKKRKGAPTFTPTPTISQPVVVANPVINSINPATIFLNSNERRASIQLYGSGFQSGSINGSGRIYRSVFFQDYRGVTRQITDITTGNEIIYPAWSDTYIDTGTFYAGQLKDIMGMGGNPYTYQPVKVYVEIYDYSNGRRSLGKSNTINIYIR